MIKIVRAPKRECGSCNLCCNYYPIKELQKDGLTWCEHCTIGKGCNIYKSRPKECRDFHCEWLSSNTIILNDYWRPERSHIIVTAHPQHQVIYYQTNPEHKDAWKENPFYDEILDMAKHAPFYVVVRDGTDGWWVKSDGQIRNMREQVMAGKFIPPNI